MKKAIEYLEEEINKLHDSDQPWFDGNIYDGESSPILKAIKQAQFDMLEEFEFLIALNEDDFDRGSGKYILKDFIEELKEYCYNYLELQKYKENLIAFIATLNSGNNEKSN